MYKIDNKKNLNDNNSHAKPCQSQTIAGLWQDFDFSLTGGGGV